MSDSTTNLTAPREYGATYTESDRRLVVSIIEWMNAGNGTRSQAKLSRAAGIKATTCSQVLGGKYPSSPTAHLEAMSDYIQREAQRADGVHVPWVETSVARTVQYICAQAHRNADIGIVVGWVGVGKTAALRRYRDAHGSALLVEAFPGMTANILLRELVVLTGATVNKSRGSSYGSREEMLYALIKSLRGSDRLLIIDEADHLADTALEYARRLSDLAGVGLVLAGTEKLEPIVKDPLGRHGQISSRVGFWPTLMKKLKEEDADQLVQGAFAGREPPASEVLEAFYAMSAGNTRVLKKLLRNVLETSARKGHAVTAEFVAAVGQQLMGLKRSTEV